MNSCCYVVLCDKGQGHLQRLSFQASCKVCPEGFYCDSTVQNNSLCSNPVQSPVPCPTGHYCPDGTKYAHEFGCPNGTFSNRTQLKTASECTDCSAGMYCSEGGLSAPSGDCHGGYYCTLGALVPMPTDGTSGDICPPGAYCPEGSGTSIPCPPGSFNPTEGSCSSKLD